MVTPLLARSPWRGRSPFRGRGPFRGASPWSRVESFSPARLFSASEPGAWYDPSDLSTLFQDAGGTTPVTAVEQPVRLMLDKSRGLVLGSELVVSPITGATSGSWAVSSTSVTRNGSSTGQAQVNLSVTPSTTKTYAVSFSVASMSGDTFFFRLGGGAAHQILAAGTYTYRIVGGGSSPITFAPWAGAAGEATITNISVRELPGNHATAPSDTARPVLRARYNLLTFSESMANGVWTKNASSLSGTLLTSTGTGEASVMQSIGAQQNGTYTLTVRASKGSASTFLYLRNLLVNDGAPAGVATFNLENGTVAYTGSSFSSATITPVSGDLYDCTVVSTKTGATAANRIDIGMTSSSTGGLACSIGNSINVYRAQLIATNDLASNAYQRVAAATDYDANPATFRAYLAFDGSDDSMSTSAINLSATDKVTVFAAVRKLSDAGRGTVVELTASAAANNGAFHLTAPNAASATFAFESDGTVLTDAVSGTTFAAPITAVLTGVGNIAGDSTILRVNGVQADADAGDQGTGNYANAAMYIGARNSSSLWFNGRLYSLIVRGAATSATDLAASEAWVNGKTGAY